MWHMKKQGKADSTIKGATQKLKQLSKMCDIQNPEEVKGILTNLEWKNQANLVQ